MAPPFRYAYCTLEDPAADLRILELESATGDAIIAKISPLKRNRIEAAASAALPVPAPSTQSTFPKQYNALSWCWRTYNGEPESSLVTMCLRCNGRNYDFSISANLAAALKVLSQKQVKTIWIDWICINQDDLEERSNQVQMMSTIYGEADCVYVWLGEHRDKSRDAFEFIPSLRKTKEFSALMHKDNHIKWNALKMLMMRDWFSRRWIIQEIALAKRAELLCGDSFLKWEHFADAISLFNVFETASREVSDLMMSQVEYKHHPDFFGSISALGAARLVDVTDNLFRPGKEDRHKRDRIERLEKLVATFTAFNASEARDTVYAILAIAKDTTPQTKQQVENVLRSEESAAELTEVELNEKLLRPKDKFKDFTNILKRFAVRYLERMQASKPYRVDYSLPISDIYVEFVRFCIAGAKSTHSTQALDIVCRPWAPDPDFFDEDEGGQEPEHGHWRAPFRYKRDYDGTRARDRSSSEPDRFVLQSPRKRVSWRPDTSKPDQDTIPSWIPSTSRCAYDWASEESDLKMIRINADVLVGEPGKSIYSACGSKGTTKSMRFEDGIIEDPDNPEIDNTHYHSMYVEGFVLGTVSTISERSQGGKIPKKWSNLVERNVTSNGFPAGGGLWNRHTAEDFWRTLVGDRTHNGQNPPRCYRLILEQAYSGQQDVDLEKQIYWGTCAPAKEVSRRIHAMIWNRMLMRVRLSKTGAANEILGLAPDTAKKDDIVCILYGCSVPVILRRYEKSENVVESQTKQQELWAKNRLRDFLRTSIYCRKLEQAAEVGRIVKRLQDELKPDTDHELLSLTRQDRDRELIKRAMNELQPVTSYSNGTDRSFAEDPDEEEGEEEEKESEQAPTGAEASTDRPALHDPFTDERTAWGNHSMQFAARHNSRRSTAASIGFSTHIPYRVPGGPSSDRVRSGSLPSPQTPMRGTSPLSRGVTMSPSQGRPPPQLSPEYSLRSEKEVFYKLIGECYVHRMMDGEAIEYQSREKLAKVLFEIR